MGGPGRGFARLFRLVPCFCSSLFSQHCLQVWFWFVTLDELLREDLMYTTSFPLWKTSEASSGTFLVFLASVGFTVTVSAEAAP